MNKYTEVLLAALLLPLPTIAAPLTIVAAGQGGSESSAVSSAKRQAAVDAEAAGFLPSDGYRVGPARVIELRHTGSLYVARVDADLVQILEPKRVLVLLSGDESQTPRLMALVQRVRKLLATPRSDKRSNIEIVDTLATGNLKSAKPADLQQTGVGIEIEQLKRSHRADAVYLLSADERTDTVFLVSAGDEPGASKKIRTLRDEITASAEGPSLTKRVADALRQDVEGLSADLDGQSLLTVPTRGLRVREGQRVVIYTEKTERVDGGELSVTTYGVVTEISGSMVRVLTDQPVTVGVGSNKLRLGLSPKRGVVIKESDW